MIRVKNRKTKKRRLNNTPSPTHKKQNIVLKTQQSTKKTPLPPPVIVDGIKNFDQFYDIIKQNISDELFNTKLMNEDRIKLNVKNEDAYRILVRV